jgi:hypothetical protein
MKTIIASAIGGFLFAVLGAMAALANPYMEGNPLDWWPHTEAVDLLLRQDRIGSLNAPGDLIHVCSPQFPISTQIAVYAWNSQLRTSHGYPANPDFLAFQWRETCDLADVKVTTEYFEQCPEGAEGCAYVKEGDYDLGEHSLRFTWVALDPELFGGSPYWDGHERTNGVVAHELGHSFGAGEYYGNVYCPPGGTVMDTNQNPNCWSHYPTSQDAYNYYLLYHADAAEEAHCDPPCHPNDTTVHLHWEEDHALWDDSTWSYRDIPNERAFCICRDHLEDDEYDECIVCVEKNTETVTLTGEPTGEKDYYIVSGSDADNSTSREYAIVHDDPLPTRTRKPTRTPTKTLTPTPTPTPTPLPDADGDGILHQDDNCPMVYNPDQLNTDLRRPNGSEIPGDYASNPRQDGLGDACDDDDDNDFLSDANEATRGTDPLKQDTDDDRVIDGAEVFLDSDPLDPNSRPLTAAPGTPGDYDGDGLPDGLERNFFGSDPSDTDTDVDGIPDGVEVKGYGSYPTDLDSDNDGCPDWLEIMDLDGDRKVDAGDVNLLNERVNGQIPPSDSDPIFDINKDGYIDFADEDLMAVNTCEYKGYTCPCSPEYESPDPPTPVAPVGGVAEFSRLEPEAAVGGVHGDGALSATQFLVGVAALLIFASAAVGLRVYSTRRR